MSNISATREYESPLGITIVLTFKRAHASGAPWEGQNALDAAFVAYSSISALRQQIKPDHRVHGVIEGKDWAPNGTRDIIEARGFLCKLISPLSYS